jgi:large subunit ribosomal protein L11
MAEKATKSTTVEISLVIKAGEATPAPPIGSMLAPQGVPIPVFCKQFNDATKHFEKGAPIPTQIFVNKKAKGAFTFRIGQPQTSYLLSKEANISKGSSVPNKQKVGYLTYAQIEKIAKQKLQDLNTKI